MKQLILALALVAGVSCQIYTKLHADGYHYDKPQTNFAPAPAKPQCPNGGSGPFCCINGSNNQDCCENGGSGAFCCLNGANNANCEFQNELPPLPSFVPQINLPKIIPIQPAARPLPVKPEITNPIPPPPPVFPPQINLPKIIPIQPAERPLPVKPEIQQPELPPLPSFVPQINLPKIIPIQTTENPLPVQPDFDIRIAPVIDVPAPFVAPKTNIDNSRDYLPPFNDEVLSDWEAWKAKFRKSYASQEEDYQRKLIFEDNVAKIKLHNANFAAGLTTIECEINKFADMGREEFIKFNTGIRRSGRAIKPHQFYGAPYPSSRTNVNVELGFNQIGFGGEAQGRSSSGGSNFGASFGSNSGSSFGLNSGSNFGSNSGSSFGSNSGSSFGSNFAPNFGSGSNAGFGSGSGSNAGFGSGSGSGFNSGSGSSPNGASSANQQGQNLMNVFMPSASLDSQVKDEVDWRKEGAITPVKNQGKCASCWAFSANAALEAHNFLRKRSGPIPLSEQNLIDCVTDNDACDGGYMTNAYEYVIRNPGVDTESSYPYEARNNTCRFRRENVGGECQSYMEIQIGNERALQQAVATVGPVAAGIDGGQLTFQFYKSGYYFEPKCEQDVNHAVLIVGYGKTENGEEYWIGKNSWDTDWGEQGYIRMAKNRNNHCGITNLASYPIV